MYNKSEIMKKAWELRKKQIRLVGKSQAKSFADCLKNAWAQAKQDRQIAENRKKLAEAKVEKPAGWKIPEWLLHEKEVWGVLGASTFAADTAVEKETKKAFRYFGAWFPKSQCERV